ncbi:MAG: SpoIIE family protein phosphatase [Crocinitomicaceae bacterium]
MKLLLLTFTLLFCIHFVIGQDYYPPIENYSTNIYGESRNPENYAVIQDERGVMYFGNSNGVLEYDGKNWRFIEVKFGAYVYSLAIDSLGTIYAGSQDEFGLFTVGNEGQMQYQSISDKLSEVDQVQITEIRYTYATNKHVFFQSKNNVFVYDISNKEVENFKTSNSFHTSYVVDNVFYVRERNVGLKQYKDGSLQLLQGTKYFKTEPCFGIVKSPFTEEGLLLFTQLDGMFELTNNKLRSIEGSKDRLEGIRTFGVKELSDGHYGLKTFESGVFIVNKNGEILNVLNRAIGLRSDDVKAMFEDRDQNLWLGLGNGISKVNYYSPLSFFNEKAGIDGNIQSVCRFNNLLYVASSYGLFLQDTSALTLTEFKQDFSIRFQVWDFETFNNSLYVATSNGVYKRISEGNYVQLTELNTNVIYFDQERNYFITSGNEGVYVWNSQFDLIWKEELGLNTGTGILKDPNRGDIWIGTSGSGALRLIFDDNEIQLDQYTENGDALCSGSVTRPIMLKDSIIFGCKYGPLQFFDENYMRELLKDDLTEEELNDPMFVRGYFEPYPLYDSLFNEEILLIEEQEDKTWYVAEHKLGFYSKEEKKFINKPFWGINYGRINNLLLEDDGTLWIGCADGLIRYKKNTRKNYKSNFTSLIRTITAGKDTIFNGAYADGAQKEIQKFSFADNDFVFSFACPYFEDEHKPLYSTFLEGYGEDWSGFSGKTDRTFTNLSEGSYVFKVKAKNIYDQISTVAEFSFKIHPPWYRTAGAYIGYVVIFILLLFVASRITSAQLKRRNEQLEEIVEERTQEISQKNSVLEHQNTEISEQKREIEDSINYAKRIQDAILPLASEMKKSLPKSFILYHPKDIVSGDFYWFSKIDNKLVIVCADCTGHGVPGAFMSMIGSDRLNIIVNERKIYSPGKILAELNRAIKNTLKQKEEESSTRDGMDAGICTIDLDKNELIYSGAHRGLWIVSNRTLQEVKGTKTAVAGFTPSDQIYKEHKFSIEKGMSFYMTSDGYADQFGGPRGKKYMVKKMKNFILGISSEGYDRQRELLNLELQKWMTDHSQNYEQIDDICVVGFEL